MYLVFFRAVSQDWARTRLSVIGLIHMYMQVKIVEGRDGAYVDGNAHVGPILVYSFRFTNLQTQFQVHGRTNRSAWFSHI